MKSQKKKSDNNDNDNNNKNSTNNEENDIFNINIESPLTEIKSEENKSKKNINSSLFPEIPKKITQLVGEASKDFDMLHPDDRILVCVSGGKDSLTLLHVMLNIKKKIPFKIDVGAMTVDPMSEDFDPSPLINYMKELNVPYFFESDKILDNAKKSLQNDSICSFCARMKRGIIYNCARREKYNVIALGQHLDDIAESFLMSVFHNGILRTMKANYLNDKGDIRIIRPLIYCREKLFKDFALKANLPVIQENCPACFQNPKERQRMKVLLAQQENLFPSLFSSLQKAMIPLMKGNIKDFIKDNNIKITKEGDKCDIKKK
jgi:tRNA 2-thiocytidine biosynthesis protein TtcA